MRKAITVFIEVSVIVLSLYSVYLFVDGNKIDAVYMLLYSISGDVILTRRYLENRGKEIE